MAYTNIDDPSAHFQTALYTGNGDSADDTNAITNDGNSDLKPDFLWIKRRDYDNGHQLADSTRGVTKFLGSETTTAEYTQAGRLASFNTDGFTVQSSSGAFNAENEPFVAWQWKANGGTTASNSDGNITSTVQANQDAGFSIVTWTGNQSASATVGHGLGVTPDMVMIKSRSAAYSWNVYLGALPQTGGNNMFCFLDTAAAAFQVAGTAFNSSTFQPTGNVKRNSGSMLAYCFNSVQGYSKFGKYVGNSNTNGAFIYTGFKPAFILLKQSSASGNGWFLSDSTRDASNTSNSAYLRADEAGAEGSSKVLDLLSNGFKLRNNDNAVNGTGHTYIYMAFAENPLVTSTGVPTTAS